MTSQNQSTYQIVSNTDKRQSAMHDSRSEVPGTRATKGPYLAVYAAVLSSGGEEGSGIQGRISIKMQTSQMTFQN